MLPNVGLSILSIENGNTRCRGFKKFAWFWSCGGKNGLWDAFNVWFRPTDKNGWNNKGNPVLELKVEGELKGEFVVVHAECGDKFLSEVNSVALHAY